jgi:hypothetical protein
MAGDILILGSVVFDSLQNPFAVPSRISAGSGQMLGIMKLIGGDRVIDSMGRDPAEIRWQGRWRGPGAVGNNDAMIAMAEAGDEVPCTWGEFFYRCKVNRYDFDYEAFFEITYSVELAVLPDQGGAGAGGLGGLVAAGMGAALGAGAFQ